MYEPFLSAVQANRLPMAYGTSTPFTYSPGELAQYLAFCSGQVEISAFEWPYVFSDPRTAPPTPKLKELLKCTSLCAAEISTLDQLTCEGRYFNFNELGLRFVRGKGAAHARWWRELTDRRRRKASKEAVEQVLEARRAANEDCSEPVVRFLREMRYETLKEASLRVILERVTASNPCQWLFVAHLNLAESGPDVMADRRQLLEVLRSTAGDLGHHVFDPTPTVARFDWRLALQGKGADKHHYTPEFRPVLGQALMETIYDMMVDVEGSAGEDDTAFLDAMQEQASTEMAAQHWQAAADAWERLRAQRPDKVAAFVLGAEALSHLGRMDEAEALALEATQRFPNELWAAHAHAVMATRRADWPEALRRWSAVRLRFPNDPGAAANIARAQMEMGRGHDALPLLHWLVDHHPKMPDGWIGLAKHATNEAQWTDAELRWQGVREHFSALPEGWGFGVDSLLALGRISEAEALARDGVAHFPTNTWLAHQVRLTLAYRHNNQAEAIAG